MLVLPADIFCTKVKYDTWKDRNYVHFLSKVVGPCCNAGCLLQILQVCNSMCSIRWPSSSLWWERCQQCGVFHNSLPKMVSTFPSEFELQSPLTVILTFGCLLFVASRYCIWTCKASRWKMGVGSCSRHCTLSPLSACCSMFFLLLLP